MDEDMIFDEDKAVEFIRKTLTKVVNDKYSDDEILYIIDIIWDYYEKNGLLELNLDATEDENVDIAKLTAYVRKEIAKDDEIVMDPSDIDCIVKGELQYEETLEDFD